MKSYQVVGIGNAIVDVFCAADDSFIELMGIEKGIMQLVERDRGEVLYAAMADRVQAPGGSVANTLAGLGNLGLTTAFIGRVHDDALGRFYAQTMATNGTDFVNAPVPEGDLPTSRSMIWLMAAAAADCSVMPSVPSSSLSSGGKPGTARNMPMMAVNTISITTRGLVSS